MLTPPLRTVRAGLLLAGLGALTTVNVLAQSEPLEQVTVVGSRIPQQKDQVQAVTIITAEQLQQRGYTTVQQALDDLAHNSGGGFDQQQGLSFAPSAAGLNLRDLGVGRALVLLDGRRLPMFPIGWNGTDSFVDLSSIPAGAVERIEVLGSGASAVYGSDAMSGVVSIVLKQRAADEITVRYGDTTRGGGAEKRLQLSTGAATDTEHAALFVEYYQRDPLWYSQRARTRSDRLGGSNGSGPGVFSPYGYPGTFEAYDPPYTTFNPGGCDTSSGSPGIGAGGYCLFNRAVYRQAWPSIDSLSATAKLDQVINTQLSWFTMLNLRSARTTVQKEPLDFNTLDADVVLPAGAPNNPTGVDAIVSRRMLELGPQQFQYDNFSYNVFAGLKGSVAGRLDWQLGLQAAKLELEVTERGWARTDRLYAALTGGLDFNGDGVGDPLDLTRLIPAAAVAQIAYTPVSTSQSTLNGINLQLNTALFALPGGTAKMSVVSEYFWERYFDHPDAELQAGNVTYYSATAAQGRRQHGGLGLEVQLPLLQPLQLNIAGRYDAYFDDSDVGGAFSPRAELQYRPSAAWLLRGGVGKSFRAPDMQRLFGGSSSGFQELINTPQCLADSGRGRGDASVASCVTPVLVGIQTSSNLKLQEEHGNHYNIGVFWKPTAAWSASLDFFAIRLRQLVQTPDSQYVLDENALRGSFADNVLPGLSAACPFTKTCLQLRPINISYKKVSGLDGAFDYAFDTGAGKFSLRLNASYLLDVSMRESATRGPVDVLRVGGLGEAARLKGGIDLSWQRGVWGSTLFVNHIGGFAPFFTSTQTHIGSFTTVNLSGRYTLPTGATAQLGVNNLFDRMPPLDLQRGDLSQPFYQQQFHDVDGASWYASFTQPF